jgi:hypothetical protein
MLSVIIKALVISPVIEENTELLPSAVHVPTLMREL